MRKPRNWDNDVQQIVQRYEAGEGRKSLATAFGTKQETIARLLREHGVTLRNDRKLNLSDQQERDLVHLYEAFEPPAVIGEIFNCSPAFIYKVLERHGVPLRPRGAQRRRFTDAELTFMREQAAAGASQLEIARALGSHQTTISVAMQEHGIRPGHTGHAAGERHGQWRGGRTQQRGYWMVQVPPDSPFASMRVGNGYVMEHRYVMAQKLGRPLETHESVHHIDGDRSHNDESNLQLRRGKHGNGAAFRCRSCGSTNVEAVRLEDVT